MTEVGGKLKELMHWKAVYQGMHETKGLVPDRSSPCLNKDFNEISYSTTSQH